MIFDHYEVQEEWITLPSGKTWQKKLINLNPRPLSASILIYLTDRNDYIIYCDSKIREQYMSFYSIETDIAYSRFNSLEVAKKSVDVFLSKYDKMKVFL